MRLTVQDAKPVINASLHSDQALEFATVEADAEARYRPTQHSQLRPHPAGELMDRAAFLRQLQREKRRADRSKTAISLAILNAGRGASTEDANELLALILDSKRETDLVCMLGPAEFAILLLDTDREGTEGFLRKLLRRAPDLRFASASGTYPDELFRSIEGLRPDLDAFREIVVEEAPGPVKTYRLKRVLDIVGALAGLVFASPILLVTAIAISLSSPGPVIFRQPRLGLKGRPFVFYKFRSMHCNNDDRIHREFVTSLIQGEHETINQGDDQRPRYKLKQDPRITRVGRFIRMTSIDELPQLWNVLKGDMSLVGPRPALAYEVERYQSWHLRRVLDLRPGLTGPWQVFGRSRTSFDEMVRLDLSYLRKVSLAYDLKLIAGTILAVVQRDGAG
jgi:lipopolysaccharide/colanic/teichoic acid biosynthesis glycosyltransferase